jgi:hypothetical protein
VNGRVLVEGGNPLHIDLVTLVQDHNRAARALLERAGYA